MADPVAYRARPHLIVGLTGGIGSGKSAATQFFADLGVDIVDADVIARVVVEAGRPALQTIVDHFGQEILHTDGSLNRSVLRERIFSNPAERQWLEALLHPLIRQEITQQLHNASSLYVILSSPLLLETGQDTLTDRVLLIDAPEALQLARTRQRDNTTEEAVTAIMATQWSRAQRQARADDVILNDGDLPHLKNEVHALHETYCALCTPSQ
ncbi:MAG: dephospho-CoA kinase [Pseudomonadota bacterium]